ncbi:hypothetical protein CR513_35746, partial [Mucuna pruriens]
MCPTLQETESDYPESVGVIGGYQFGKQLYQSRPSDNQQFGKQPFWPGPSQGPCASKRFGPILNVPQGPVANHEFQQYAVSAKHERHKSRPQDANTISTRSSNLPSQTIPNLRGNVSVGMLRSGKALSQPASQGRLTGTATGETIPLPFPTRAVSTKKPDSDEELLRMFRKVEINIPLLDAIKQIPKYAKFLKELCVHKRKKMKGSVEVGDLTTGAQALPKKCQDFGIFSIPCTIGDCTFVDAMLDLGASINVMPASIYKSLNFGDLEPTGMTIQLANRVVVQPLGTLEDVLGPLMS